MKTKPPTTPPPALLLSWLVPLPVRTQLRWRCPLDCRLVSGGCLCVQVGPPTRLQWLRLQLVEGGVRLWLWILTTAGTAELATETVRAEVGEVSKLLQKWAAEFCQQ